jgi:DnaJ-class molecular chaperone
MSQPQRNVNNGAPLTCAWCTGSGKWAVSAGYVVSCMVCGGKGQVMVKQPAGQCQQCAGSGRRSVANPCLTCAGTGWARVFG